MSEVHEVRSAFNALIGEQISYDDEAAIECGVNIVVELTGKFNSWLRFIDQQAVEDLSQIADQGRVALNLYENRLKQVGVSEDSTVYIQGVRAMITPNFSTQEWRYDVIEPATVVVGNYAGLVIYPWYEVPTGQRLTDENETTYFRPRGLYVSLGRLSLPCSPELMSEIEPQGMVLLNHGEPELYCVTLRE